MKNLKYLILFGFMALFIVACGNATSDFYDIDDEEFAESSSAVSSSSKKVSNSSSSAKASSSSKAKSSSSAKSKTSSSSEEDVSSSSEEEEEYYSSSVSSSSEESSSSISDGGIKEDGYYKKNCPKGHKCRYVTTDFLNSSASYGEYLDERDDQVYKTVEIGSQIWMAQNLNYRYVFEVKGENSEMILDSSSFCYFDMSNFCDMYGRLYMWSAAIDSAGLFSRKTMGCGGGTTCELGENIHGVCPEGWHLPSAQEFDTLYAFVEYDNSGVDVGTSLKSSSGWVKDNGTSLGVDFYGFAALPAGKFDYAEQGYRGYFWSASEGSMEIAGFMALDYNTVSFETFYNSKEYGYSIRCVRN